MHYLFLFLVLYGAQAKAFVSPKTPQGASLLKGVHEIEWEQHRGVAFEVSSPESIIPLKKIDMGSCNLQVAQAKTCDYLYGKPLNKTIYGYYPYWMGSAYTSLQYELLSHIAYFSVEVNTDGSLGSIPNPSILENLRNIAHLNGVSVMIVGTQFNDPDIIAFLNSPGARSLAISNLFNLVKNYGLDGVNIDFENPNNSVKDSLTKFMTSLTAYFHDSIPGSHVSIATPDVDWWGAFDYELLASNTDGLFIMGYNYYWSGSSYAGPVAPLFSSSLWGTYSVMWTINDYLTQGSARDKLILGCPYYGYRWPTEDSLEHSATRGNGTALTYKSAVDSSLVYGKLWGALREAFYGALDSAIFVSNSIPDTMLQGETKTVVVTVKNAGESIWPDSGDQNPFRLGAGSLNTGSPHDNEFIWSNFYFGGYSNSATNQRAFIGWDVDPGDNFVFIFDIKAPLDTGIHWWEARMVHEGVCWFGECLSKPVYVSSQAVVERSYGVQIADHRLEVCPNPFTTKAMFRVQGSGVSEREEISLKIYDLSGQLVETLVMGEIGVGCYEISWEARGVSGGVYFVRVVGRDYKETKKLVLMR